MITEQQRHEDQVLWACGRCHQLECICEDGGQKMDADELKRRIDAGLCIKCGKPFTDANVHTEAGWAETKISGLCEDCFDQVTAEPDDDPDEWDRAMAAF